MCSVVGLCLTSFLLAQVPISPPPLQVDPAKSAGAVLALEESLAKAPGSLEDLLSQAFTGVALTKADALKARGLLWATQKARLARERAAEIEARSISDGSLAMPFSWKVFGEKPAGGRSLWISLHGGGGAPKSVNDSQWENQKRLYALEEGIYIAPRAPTDTWDLWHQGHIDRMFDRLIQDLIAIQDVDPDRVYVLGYSAGGDGVYQIGPRMADRWAGAAMMAGHPNDASPLSLRNVAFALQAGANDSAYNRNKVAGEWGAELDRLRAADPGGYEHYFKLHEGKGHWMDREDAAALPWMAKFRRNPVPSRVVWKQDDRTHEQSYWLAVPAGRAKPRSLVVAERKGQTIDLEKLEGVERIMIRLDDRMLDLDNPVRVTFQGQKRFEARVARTIGAQIRTLVARSDPGLIFDAEVILDASTPNAR